MLLFDRRVGQGFTLGGIASIRVTDVRSGNRVKIAVDAPRHVSILRDELVPRPDGTVSPYAGFRVLFVEDDEDFAELLGGALDLHGVKAADAFTSADEAIHHLEEVAGTDLQPDVILVDYRLPGDFGHRLVQWIRNHEILGRLPVVMLSGDNSPPTIEACIEAGASAFMLKPSTFTEIVRTLERVLAFWASPDRLA